MKTLKIVKIVKMEELRMDKFQVGEKVEHILSKDYLLVLKCGKEQYLCRTKDLREIWFYDFELRPIAR